MSLGVVLARGHKNQEAKKHPVDYKQVMMMMMVKEMIRVTAQTMMMMTKMLMELL